MYYILKQFYPEAQIWVEKLTPEDLSWEFETIEEAEAKATELEANDVDGRKYKVAERINPISE